MSEASHDGNSDVCRRAMIRKGWRHHEAMVIKQMAWRRTILYARWNHPMFMFPLTVLRHTDMGVTLTCEPRNPS